MRKVIHLILLMPILTFSQNTENDSISVSLSTIFYHMDKHFVHSFTYNYGMNHLYAAAATYGMVKGGIDWEVYKFSEKNRAVAYAGFPSVLIGGMAPLAVPAILYLYGKSKKNDNVRLTAIALSQATILSLIITSGYKAFTARRPPEILDEKAKTDTDFSDDFKFGFMNRGIFHGWPSGHTSNAFAMAVTLIELYPENKSLKTFAYLYAFFIGIGISTNIHWTSDFVAGALIGYSIGKSVGRGFNQLKNKRNKESVYHFYITPYGINFSYQF